MKKLFFEHRLAVGIFLITFCLLAIITAVCSSRFLSSPQDKEKLVSALLPPVMFVGEDVTDDSTVPKNNLIANPEAIPQEDISRNFTSIEKAKMTDGSIGVLTIQKIGVSAPIYESADNNMEAMTKGIAHFPFSSAWNANVSLSAHNWTQDGKAAYFKDLHLLKEGDVMVLETALGERTYTVTSLRTIDENDWSFASPTEENRLTLITCKNDNPAKRLWLTAVEVEAAL